MSKLQKLLGADAPLPQGKSANTEQMKKKELQKKQGFIVPDFDPNTTPYHSTISHLFEEHKKLSAAEKQTSGKQILSKQDNFSILLSVKSCMLAVGEPAEIFFSLYSLGQKKFITDEFFVALNHTGFIDNPDGTIKSQVLFADLTRIDIRSRLFLVARVYRKGTVLYKPGDKKSKKESQANLRRPFAVGVSPLSSRVIEPLLTKLGVGEDEPPHMIVFHPPQEKDFHDLHSLIINEQDLHEPLVSPKNSKGIAFGLKVIVGNRLDPAVKTKLLEYEHVPIVYKTEWVGPRVGQDINELCIDLVEANVVQASLKKNAEKNVLIQFELRDNEMNPYPNCIRRAIGPAVRSVTTYQSSVYYHSNTPVYHERIRIDLPDQISVNNYHLFFQLCHCSKSEHTVKPFAFAFMPLCDIKTAAVLENNTYGPNIYEYSTKYSVDTTTNYFMITPDIRQKISIGEKIVIRTELRSTHISRDPDIMACLNWQIVPPQERKEILIPLNEKLPTQIAEVFSTLMDSLVNMMTDTDDTKVLISAFATFINLLSAVGQRSSSYINRLPDPHRPLDYTQPYVDDYVDNVCSSPVVWRKILQYYGNLMQWTNKKSASAENAQYTILQNSMKGVDYILRVIVKSYTAHLDNLFPLDELGRSSKEREQDKASFAKSMEQIFHYFHKMMKRSDVAWIQSFQLDSIANMRNVFDRLKYVMYPRQIVQLACDFTDNIRTSNHTLNIYKLNLISDLVQMKIVDPKYGLLDLHSSKSIHELDLQSLDVWESQYIPRVLKQIFIHFTLYDFNGADGPYHRIVITPQNQDFLLQRAYNDLYCLYILKQLLPIIETRRDYHTENYKAIKKGIAFLLPSVMRLVLTLFNQIEHDENVASPEDEKKTPPALGMSASTPSTTNIGRHDTHRSLTGLESKGDLTTVQEDDPMLPPPPPPKEENQQAFLPTSLKNSNPYHKSNLPGLPEFDYLSDAIISAITIIKILNKDDFTYMIDILHQSNKKPEFPDLVIGDDFNYPPPPPEEDEGFALPPPDFNPQHLISTTSEHTISEFNAIYRTLLVAGEMVRASSFNLYWVLLRVEELHMGMTLLDWCGDLLLTRFNSQTIYFDELKNASSSYLSYSNAPAYREKVIWDAYWGLGTHLLRTPECSGANISEERHVFALEKLGSFGQTISAALLQCWSELTGKHLQLLDLLVRPMLYLAQNLLPDLNQLGSNIYWDLLIETLKAPSFRPALQSHTIDAIWTIVKDFGDGALSAVEMDKHRAFWRDNLKAKVANSKLRQIEKNDLFDFISGIYDLFTHLERLPSSKQSEDVRAEASMQLIKYLQQTDKEDLVERCIQYLCELHIQNNNFVETAFSQIYHSNLYKCSDKNLDALEFQLAGKHDELSQTKRVPYLEASIETDRKIILLEKALASYEKAKYWEKCIEVCKSLEDAFDKQLYDYSKLHAIIVKRGDLMRKILTEDRIFPSFYRVFFVGDGWDDVHKDQEFVYRSGIHEFPESVREFSDRMKTGYPDALIVNSSDVLDLKKYPNNKIIQITTLQSSSPEEMKGATWEWKKSNQSTPARCFKAHRSFDTKVFTYTRMIKVTEKGINEYATLWSWRTFIVTENALPGLMRREKVVERKDIKVSPIENAIWNVSSKNDEISDIISNMRFDASNLGKNDPEREAGAVQALSMQLAGVLDAAVMGGLSKYKEAFFYPDYLTEHPDHVSFIAQFKQVLLEQRPILEQGLEIFKQRATSSSDQKLRPLYDHLNSRFAQMQNELAPLYQ